MNSPLLAPVTNRRPVNRQTKKRRENLIFSSIGHRSNESTHISNLERSLTFRRIFNTEEWTFELVGRRTNELGGNRIDRIIKNT